jgi:AraC-like DNA-binding protein
LAGGSVFIADPQIPHEISINGSKNLNKLELIYFLFRIYSESNTVTENFNENLLRTFMKEHKIMSQENTKIANYLEFINHYDNNNPNDDQILIQVYKMMLLDMIRSLVVIAEGVNSISASSKSMIDIAMIYIRENIGRKLRVDEIAQYTGTSTRNLQYLFRKHLNMTIVHYINVRKINLACSYLKMNISVTNVAKMIGIEDVSVDVK